MSCVFCGIVAGTIPSRTAYKDDSLVAFHDIQPQAPVHVLIVPRRHIASPLDLAPEDDALVGSMVRRARELARELGLEARGFRLVFNCGDDAGYSVFHLHLHLLGGRQLGRASG